MKRSTIQKISVGLVAGGLLAALLFITGIRTALIHGIQSVQSYIAGKSISWSFIQNRGDAVDLRLKNLEQQQTIADLIFQNAQLQKYAIENDELQKALNYRKHYQYDSVLSKVIGRDPDLDNTLVIDQGSEDGVTLGLAVAVNDGIFIGTIVAVHPHQSTVQLITDSNVKVPVALASGNQVIGVAQGEYGLSIYVDLIPQALELKEKEIIVTAPLQSLIPQGMVIGTVNRLISRENDLFKKVSLTPPIDYTAIQFVSVIKPKL